MLWALLTDFRRWGAVRTITALDPRFEGRIPGVSRDTLPADEVVSASHAGHQEIYRSLLSRSDCVIIIAPETAGILAGLTNQAESAGIPVLGSASSAVVTAGDKALSCRLFQSARLPIPRTIAVDFASAPKTAEQMDYPLIIKPVDGIGSEGVCRADCFSDVRAVLDLVRPFTSSDQILLQPFVDGTPVSVSLLVSGGRCAPLSLNRQLVETGRQFRYLGSQVPFEHKESSRAIELACSSVRLVPGLSGYVGVDLIIAGDSCMLIEINPRLTTSYIGLRQVAVSNLAEAIVKACLEGVLPERFQLSGQVTIRKDDPEKWGRYPISAFGK